MPRASRASRSRSPAARPAAVPVLQRRDLMLLPFLVLVLLYLLTFQPLSGRPQPSLLAAIAKATPILYLSTYVGLTPNFQDNSLALGARVGFVLSSLGDMCLVWFHALFLPGVLFFSLAQMGYIFGLRSWIHRGHYPTGAYLSETVTVGALSYLFVFTSVESWVMAMFLLGYIVLLFYMAYLCLQRHLVENNLGSLCGLVGGVSFLVSDLLIAITKWRLSLPLSELLIMVTYYLAQGGIAAGAVYSTRVKRRE